jgi:SAM-dependent methyltransferase
MSAANPLVTSEQPLLAAIRTLAYTGFGAVPVVDPEGLSLGVLTQRDVISHLANVGSLDETTVGELATECGSVTPDAPLDATEHPFHLGQEMLPVVDDGRLVGVLTAFDLRAQGRLASALGRGFAGMKTEISPSDSMYSGSRGAYVMAGASALKCVRQAMQSVKKSKPTRILDLPSGAGRVLRVLKAAFPEAHLTACDLDREGVDFCSRVLGAEPVYSHSDPARVELDGNFDVIWCGSLFTHLGARRWPGFLELLGGALAPEGLLVFTTHGRHSPAVLRQIGVSEAGIRKMLDGFDRAGFGFSETPPDAEEDWGLAIASADWIRSQLDQTPKLRFVEHVERAWQPPTPRQDVVTCVRPAE